jgi:hypothetical protein
MLVAMTKGQAQYVNWLQDERMLPAIVPNAQIMRYGYEPQWDNKVNTIHLKTSTVASQLLQELRSAILSKIQSAVT